MPTLLAPGFRCLGCGAHESELDPDKQFRNGMNPQLAAAISGHRAVYFGGPLTRETAIDIGRSWREQLGIDKRIINGASVWTDTEGA